MSAADRSITVAMKGRPAISPGLPYELGICKLWGYTPPEPRRLCQQLRDHISLDVRQAEIASHVVVGQTLVVHAQLIEDSGL